MVGNLVKFNFMGNEKIKLFFVKGCKSCKKAKEWLDFQQLSYEKFEIRKDLFDREDVVKILSLTEGGVGDILSTRCREYQDLKVNIDQLKMEEFIALIDTYRKLLRHPILVGETCLQIGYNEDQIRCFIPHSRRKIRYKDNEHCLLAFSSNNLCSIDK